MKKVIVIVAALAFVAASFSSASAIGSRTSEEAYNMFGATGGSISNYVQFATYKGERTVTISIEDVSGRDVAAQVKQDLDRNGKWDVLATICGQSEKAVRIAGGRPLRVSFVEEVCSDSGIPAWVMGSVTATFTG